MKSLHVHIPIRMLLCTCMLIGTTTISIARQASTCRSDDKCPDGSTPDPVLGCRQTTRDVQIQIQSALQNNQTLINDSIHVTVNDNVIDLSGSVASANNRKIADGIARCYAGNLKVKDHMTVTGKSK